MDNGSTWAPLGPLAAPWWLGVPGVMDQEAGRQSVFRGSIHCLTPFRFQPQKVAVFYEVIPGALN